MVSVPIQELLSASRIAYGHEFHKKNFMLGGCKSVQPELKHDEEASVYLRSVIKGPGHFPYLFDTTDLNPGLQDYCTFLDLNFIHKILQKKIAYARMLICCDISH